MPFATSIQALIGPHTAQSSGNTQCGVDWARNSVYIIGLEPTVTTNYLSSVNVLTGSEQIWADVTTFTGFGGAAGNGAPPVATDADGNVYIGYSALNGGGLIQIDSSTLTQLAFGGTNAVPPAGFSGILQCGVNNIPVGSTQFMMVTAIGGTFADLRYAIIYDEVTFAGRAETFGPGIANSRAVNCSGKPGSNLGFIAAGPDGVSDLQTVILSKVTCATGGGWVIGDWPTQNANITIATIATLVPTDIDAGWSEIYPVGICLDQTDGNPMMWLQPATSSAGYMVKFDKTTGAIIWQSALPATASVYKQSIAYSSVTRQRLFIFTSGPNTVTTINTSDGSSSSYTTGLAGIIAPGYQSSNDGLGALLLNVEFTETAGSPAKLNTTPSSYTGWSMLYVADIPVPTPSNRRFLAQYRPVRRGPSSRPTPVPITDDARITEEGDIRITMEADIRIILP